MLKHLHHRALATHNGTYGALLGVHNAGYAHFVDVHIGGHAHSLACWFPAGKQRGLRSFNPGHSCGEANTHFRPSVKALGITLPW